MQKRSISTSNTPQKNLLSVSNNLQKQGNLEQNKEYAPLFDVVANALKIVADNYSDIQNSCVICQDLLKEIVTETNKIGDKVEEYTDDVQALAFRLVEAASPVIKEAVLNKVIENTDEVQVVKAFYEESGNWDKSERTITAQLYHSL